MRKLILLGLAALALLVAGFAVASNFSGGKNEVKNAAPPLLAIATEGMLLSAGLGAPVEEIMAAQSRLPQPESPKTPAADSVAHGGATSVAPQAKPPVGEGAPSAQPARSDFSSEGSQTIFKLMFDELEVRLSSYFSDSKRFSVLEPSKFRQSFRRLLCSGNGAAQNGDKNGEQSAAARNTACDAGESKQAEGDAKGKGGETVAQKLMRHGVEFVTPKSKDGQEGVVAMQRTVTGDPVSDADFAEAAKVAGAKYLLIVRVQEPRVTFDIASTIRFETDPVIIYRVFDVTKGTQVMSEVIRLERPLSVNVSPMTQAMVIKSLRELMFQLNEQVSRVIALGVADAIYPPRIAKVSPLTMTRGANDGVEVGDVFEVYRVPKGDSGIFDMSEDEGLGEIRIASDQEKIGRVRVTEVQSNSSLVQPLGDVTLEKRDMLKRVGGGTAGNVAGGGVGGGQGGVLGQKGIDAAKAEAKGGETNVVRVAVGDFRIYVDAKKASWPSRAFEQALMNRLMREPRIKVLSRESLAQLEREEQIGGGGRVRVSGAGGGPEGAGFLVLGDVTIGLDRTSNRVSVGSVSREVSASYTMSVEGALRIESLRSEVIEAVSVAVREKVSGPNALTEASSMRAAADAFADAAAKKLLLQLFPMKIVQVEDGGLVRLNRGGDAGLKVGDTLRAYRIGAPIVDDVTGALLSAGARTYAGDLAIVDVEGAIATAKITSDYKAKVGDTAELASPAPAKASAKVAAGKKKPVAAEAEVPW